MKKNKDEILKYVNENLKGYEGYIQLMGEKIDEKHLFLAGERTPSLGEDELIYEAHFFNANLKKSISIRQINDAWFVDETELNKVALEESDIKTFYPKFGNFKIKMAQIWQDEKDEFCEVPQGNGTLEGLPVLKLQKIVFAGFVKDEKDKK
ncbi:TIGR04423 family type III CRISPR-associated protein [uncultured Campylobacter sp.]|uniref:TIGR04423 family type III CRISPR-associated protein n=1 Tax=uncultured Campylobacter sp. TaxID=218934 RepID=UPI002634FA40|nr:TIGR04423 family type III CRISPR-associated protein [uncultured Campylobacter sp.]